MIFKQRVLDLNTIFHQIDEHYPETKFWDGFSKHETRNSTKFYKHRAGMANEIRIEFDSEDKNANWTNVIQTCINIYEVGYNFAVYYVDGGRSPHIHIYDIDEMDNLTYDQRTKYRTLFLKRFCPEGSEPDLGLCEEKHLCALEFVNHFKYNQPKKLLRYFFQGELNNQGCENDLYWKAKEEDKKKKLYNRKKGNTQLKFGDKLNKNKRDYILERLSFEPIFDKYGIEYRGTMALCPFHADKDKSLSFSNEKGLWKCFGCNEKGDIITLIKKLKEVKRNGNKKGS